VRKTDGEAQGLAKLQNGRDLWLKRQHLLKE
jgi:hypothetical protein